MEQHRAIKKLNINGQNVYKYVFDGTPQCHLIHKKSVNQTCCGCPMLNAIFEKLYTYESIEYDDKED